MIDGFEYEPMKDTAPQPAPVWALCWTVMSGLILLNMFIAILSDSYVFVQDRIKKQDAIENSFELPTWAVFFRSKIPCLRRRRSTGREAAREAEEIRKMTKEAIQ